MGPPCVPGLPIIRVRANRWPTTTDVGRRVSSRLRTGLATCAVTVCVCDRGAGATTVERGWSKLNSGARPPGANNAAAPLGATRTGLPLGTSNLVADEDGLFIVIDNRTCLRLDAKTGKTVQT